MLRFLSLNIKNTPCVHAARRCDGRVFRADDTIYVPSRYKPDFSLASLVTSTHTSLMQRAGRVSLMTIKVTVYNQLPSVIDRRTPRMTSVSTRSGGKNSLGPNNTQRRHDSTATIRKGISPKIHITLGFRFRRILIENTVECWFKMDLNPTL